MNTTGSFRDSTVYENGEQRQLSDYGEKKIAGYRAMQVKPNGEFKYPTNVWSGYGISLTSPAASYQNINNKVIAKYKIIKLLLIHVFNSRSNQIT